MAFVVSSVGCTAVGPFPTPLGWLEQAFRGDVRDRDARAVRACLYDPVLAAFIGAVDSHLPPTARVLLVPAQPLDNLPLHLVPHNGRPWGTSRHISLLPAAGLVATFSRAAGGRPTSSLVAGDSDGTLPWAQAECIAVAAALGTEPLLGPACTFEAVAAALAGDRLDVIHLAVHGRGDSTRGGRAALRFATSNGAAWVPFDELLALGLNAELVFLSGCSTALSGPVHGQGAVSAAQAALEAGAGAVIGCLWPVEDQAAAAFATALYGALAPAWEAGPTDAREAMASARLAVIGAAGEATLGDTRARRDGRRNLSNEPGPDLDPAIADALRWAPFVLVGDPIVAG
jgi:CHAT domain-containing protein